ncbi:Hpt domain-containing protein [Desulfobulbus sp.]|uniref:Hpt domain-containing protein n=1 Tax=Desulfobulbus sp. TaxID=895 RepID=UPI00286F6345|nr:Hpt domain-containing protein [Desulfobulbus sp.]
MSQNKNDFLAGYIEEVQAYVPTMRAAIGELRANPRQRDTLEELHRLAHIIRGASSMVGIGVLSRIAGRMEDTLEQALEGRRGLAEEALDAMDATVARIGSYCQDLQQGVPVDEAQLTDLAEADFKGLDANADEMSLLDSMEEPIFDQALPFAEFSDSESDDELTAAFQTEAEEHLEALHQAIQVLESQVTGTVPMNGELRETVRQIRRSVHTIKGAASVIGLADLAAYAHLVEDVLDWLYETAGSVEQRAVPHLADALDLLAIMILNPALFDEQRAQTVLAALQTACMGAGTSLAAHEDGEEIDVLSEAVLDALASPADTADMLEDGATTGAMPDSLFSDEEKQLLYEGFLEEAEEHLQQLHASMQILTVEIDKRVILDAGQKEEVRKIRRAVHTIKGASAVIGLRDISAYAHGVEDFLDWLYAGSRHLDPETVEILTNALDCLGLLVESPESVPMDRRTDLLRRLLAISRENKLEEPLVENLPDLSEASAVADATSLTGSADREADAAAPLQVAASEASRTIRINQNQLDVLINLANELLVGISGFDQNMGLFKKALEEMELTSRRLKDIALELETKFEVKALDQLSRHFVHIDKTVADLKASQSFSEFDALELDRYTQLNLIIRSLNESAIDVAAIHTNLGGVYSGIGGDIGRQHRVIRELQVQMMRTRLSPMATLSSRLNRTLRDVASRLGKRVRLVIEGERVELDRMVWEKLADPFMHLVRNAIHHGIESPEERQACGKPALATVTLAGRREGNHLVIRFSDDGRGLDFAAIREKARRFGLGHAVDQMDEEQLTELIFYPGFSTKTISEISGRGVGMDVVRANIKELQGSVTVETGAGAGTTFVLRVPLTLGVVRALLVKVGEVTYGIALNDIKDIHRLEQGSISFADKTCHIAGETVPWHSLTGLLGIAGLDPDEDHSLVLNMLADGRTIGLSIPQITGQKEIVIKGLGTHLRSVAGVSGAAVMGDGSIVPVLDIPELAQAASRAKHRAIASFNLEIPRAFTVMIVDDSISIRRVMSRLVVANGWAPVEAKDGLDAVEQLEMAEVRPDCIVLDIEMPRMNGFEFLAKLPHVPGGKDIPVVMLTSRTSAKHQEKAMQLGARAFLNKPCKDEEFVDTVLRLTGQSDTPVPEAEGRTAR